ncbi:hypothetical protein EVAR_85165_1 [Eumeta japonica]|uniref:Uncharacterized protein n=1 Tax=Eumeta variegata TaxID=151549 RepID=A0A4C2A252_EUMVA|nr:hypothetical protein EVAR_85165_1 [Eumeta japonica]
MHSQARGVIATVYQRMKFEAENGVERNRCEAHFKSCGSKRKNRYKNFEAKRESDSTGAVLRSPHKMKKPRKCLRRDIDNFDMAVVRRTINNFHKEYKQFSTLKSLKKILNEKINYKGCIETLRRLLFDLGYEWINTDDNRRMLSEKHDIQMLRYKYLKQLRKYREEGRNIVYTDESYIHTTHVQNKSWANENGSIAQKNF